MVGIFGIDNMGCVLKNTLLKRVTQLGVDLMWTSIPRNVLGFPSSSIHETILLSV